ncbi:unnamed protein product [Phaeothamnion confervicola]
MTGRSGVLLLLAAAAPKGEAFLPQSTWPALKREANHDGGPPLPSAWRPLFSRMQPARAPTSRRRQRERCRIYARGTGATATYHWIEGPDELEVHVPLPAGTAAKDVNLEIHKERISLSLAGQTEPVLAGALKGDVAVRGSHWTMEEEDDGSKMLYLRLEKLGGGSDEWMGLLEAERPTELRYDEGEEDLDVDEYVKSIGGYDPEKVDKSMYQQTLGDWQDTAIRQLARGERDAFKGRRPNATAAGTAAISGARGRSSGDNGGVSLPLKEVGDIRRDLAEVVAEMKAAGTLEDLGDELLDNELDLEELGDVSDAFFRPDDAASAAVAIDMAVADGVSGDTVDVNVVDANGKG